MPSLAITPQKRTALRAAAHPLRPVVLIGERGLTDAVLKEIDRALTAHGLIKVRAGGEDRDAREAMLASVCEALSCAPVHHLGKTLILYRPTEAEERAAQAAARPPRLRAPGEPHTPKKLAAQGKKLAKPSRRAARRDDDEAAPAPRPLRAEAARPARPGNRPAARKAGGLGSGARRTGSALTLRAGARPSRAPRKAATGARTGRGGKK